MRLNSPDVAIQELLGSDAGVVVASLWLFDGSSYAAGVRRHLAGLIDPRFQGVVRTATLDGWKDAAAPLFAAGFQRTIQPLTLMENIPGLCFWIGEDSEVRMSEITQGITSLDMAHPCAFLHVVIVLGTELQRASKLQVVLQQRGAVVVVSQDGAVKQPVESLAQASAAYGHAVWRRYWEHPERDLAKAMWRPPGGGVLTLGLSVARIDVEYHTQRWQEKLCRDQWQRWMKPHKLPARTQPTTTSLVDLLRHLLPEWYLAFAEESELPKLTISSSNDEAMIAYRSPTEKPTSRNWWHRSQFRQWMVRLRAHVDFLSTIALANCRRFVDRRARSLSSPLTAPLRPFLFLPREPEGLVSSFRGRLQLCINYARTLTELRIAENSQPGTSFEQDWKLAQRRVSSIPHLGGALARCGLIAIGLVWLVIGPWVWLGGANPLTDRWLFYVTVSAGVVLAISIIGVIVHHHYAAVVAANSIERASRNAEVRHLSDVGGLAIQHIRGAANELQKQLEQRAEQLEDFEEQAKKQPNPVQRDPTTVAPDNLSLAAVDRLIEPAFDGMRKQLFANLGEQLPAPQSEQFIEFDYQRWQPLLEEAARAVARDHVSRLRYEDCAAEEKDADSRLITLFSNLVKEGSSPALPGTSADPCAGVVLFGRRELWEPHRGQHDRVAFYPLRCRDLLLLSIHSIPT